MFKVETGIGFAPPISPNVPCCGVLACSLFAEIPFEQAWRIIGETKRGNWRGRTSPVDYIRLFEAVGVKHRKKTYPGPAMTVQRFIDWQTVSGVHYMIHVSGHMLHYKDGILTDQTYSGKVEDHPARRMRVKDFYRRLS